MDIVPCLSKKHQPTFWQVPRTPLTFMKPLCVYKKIWTCWGFLSKNPIFTPLFEIIISIYGRLFKFSRISCRLSPWIFLSSAIINAPRWYLFNMASIFFFILVYHIVFTKKVNFFSKRHLKASFFAKNRKIAQNSKIYSRFELKNIHSKKSEFILIFWKLFIFSEFRASVKYFKLLWISVFLFFFWKFDLGALPIVIENK